jgi:ferritin
MQVTTPKKPAQVAKKVVDLLQERLADEYLAFYVYRSAANHLKNWNYKKASAFFDKESADELSHAKRIEEYLIGWNVVPTLPVPTAADVNIKFKDIVDIISYAYGLELDLLKAYDDTSSQIFPSDKITYDFLQQFREIQLKSVQEYSDLLNALMLVLPCDDGMDLLYWEQTYF